MIIIIGDNIRSCVAKGNEYSLGRPFSFMEGCVQYNCDCHTDGSWECPADRAKDTCYDGHDKQPTTDREQAPTQRSEHILYYTLLHYTILY